MQTQCAGHRAGGGQKSAPGIIGVFHNRNTGAVQNRYHITLKAQNVVVSRTVIYNRQGPSAGIVVKVQRITAVGHMGQLTTVVGIVVGGTGTSVAALSAHTRGIVNTAPRGATLTIPRKL